MFKLDFGKSGRNPRLLAKNFIEPLKEWAETCGLLEVYRLGPKHLRPREEEDICLFTFTGIHKDTPLAEVSFLENGRCKGRVGEEALEPLGSWKRGARFLIEKLTDFGKAEVEWAKKLDMELAKLTISPSPRKKK